MRYEHSNTLYAKRFIKYFSALHFVIPFTIEHFRNFCYNTCIKKIAYSLRFSLRCKSAFFYNPKVETFSIF